MNEDNENVVEDDIKPETEASAPKTEDLSTETKPTLEAVAEHDYISTDPKVLSFSTNDKLILLKKASSDWWHGSKDGVKGLIADNHIKIIENKTEDDTGDAIARANSVEEGVSRRVVSFNSNLKKWQKTTERNKEKAPDLLKDVLDQEIEVAVGENKNFEGSIGTEV